MAKLKGLGKGLDALLSASKFNVSDGNSEVSNSDSVLSNSLQEINLELIKPGKYQPRRVFDKIELQELSDSIKENGVIQPIIIRMVGNNRYELIAGERRWRASKLAGLTSIPAVIREFSDEEALVIALIENIQRKDLNIVEEAEGYRKLIDEFGLTHEALAKVTGKSRSNVSNTLRLLNLNTKVLELLLQGELDMGHARALLPLAENSQLATAYEVIAKKLTTAQTESKVSAIMHENNKSDQKSSYRDSVDPDINHLEESLADKIGMMVAIKHNRAGNGKIVINYASVDELEGFLEQFDA